MAKCVHVGARSKKHGCRRCGEHTRKIYNFQRKAGSIYTLCLGCAKAVGKQVIAPTTQQAAS